MGGDRGSVCPTVGPGALCVPRWDQIHPHLLSPSFLLLSCLSPASPSRSMSVLVSLPRAPWALTPAVSPAPPGAEVPAPTSRGRHHHRRSLERVPGNGATCPQATSVLLSVPLSMTPCPCVPSSVRVCYCVRVSGLSVCLSAHPVMLEPLSSPPGPNRDGGVWGMNHPCLCGAGGDVQCPQGWRCPHRLAGPTGSISVPAPAPAWPTSSTGGW